jgi:hypothetical protein
MPAVDFFYVSLGAGFILLIVSLVVVAVQISRILENVRRVTGDAAEVTEDVTTIKNGIKIAILSVAQNFLEKAKGEEKSERKK